MTMTSSTPTLDRTARPCDIYAGGAALMYDDLARQDSSEIDVLIQILRHAGATTVLDLGCGSGRITLPLLAALPVTFIAVDTSAPLLALLADRLLPEEADRCRVVHADATLHREPRPVDAAVMGTSTISLFDRDARTRLFATTRANLTPGGIFVLTNFCWTPGHLADSPVVQRGASGAHYALEEVWVSDERRRVTVRSLTSGRQAESEPWNLRHEQLVVELTAAGFTVPAALALHEGPDGRNTLIIAEVPR